MCYYCVYLYRKVQKVAVILVKLQQRRAVSSVDPVRSLRLSSAAFSSFSRARLCCQAERHSSQAGVCPQTQTIAR